MTASSPPVAPVAGSSRRLVIGSVGLLLLLAALDQTIVSTALPTIVADLGGLNHLSWVVTAYILSSTVAAPLYGKLGDLYGRRRMVFISVGLFLAGSLLCGAAGSMEFLIAARAVQGLGGGGLFVLALSVVGDVIAPRERGKVQGVFAAVFSLSSVLGPLLGGWFVEAVSWHWIFFINIPLGALAVAGFAAGFAPKGARTQHRIDWAGAAALSVGLASLTLVTSLGGRSFGWNSPVALGLIAAALVATAAFVAAERRAAEPILPLSLFSENVFLMTSAIGFAVGAVLFGTITFLPLFLQVARGISPTESGLMLVPMTLGIVTSSTLAGQYMGRTGRYRVLPIVGTTLVGTGTLLLTRLGLETSTVIFSIFIAVLGLGLGCIFPVVTTAVQNAVPRQHLGTATAAGVMFRQVGGSLSVAVFGALFASRMAGSLSAAGLGDLANDIGPQTVAKLPEAQRDLVAASILHGIQPIFWTLAVVAGLALCLSFVLREVPLTSRMVPKGE